MIRGPSLVLSSSQPNREFARAPTRLFVWRQSRQVGDRPDGLCAMGRANPYRGLVARLSADEFARLKEVVEERSYREEVGAGMLAETAEAYRPAPRYPSCGREGPWRDGSTSACVPRWRRPSCAARFNSLTGTVLEHCRKPFPAWVSFVRLMRHNVPIECAAEACGLTHKTAFEWRHRVPTTVSGCQSRVTLQDVVRVGVPREPGARQAGADCKGGAPYPGDRRDLPQLGVGAPSPVI